MNSKEIFPGLFRKEYGKLTAVLYRHFGLEHLEIAEDIASETFLKAMETWGFNGVPANPEAWLYTVAKNKTRDYLKHQMIFKQKVKPELGNSANKIIENEIDLSPQNIEDSQLQMIFAICHPAVSVPAQIGLALRILCGFGIEEIANAFLTTREVINKRLFRAKEKLRIEKVKIEFPCKEEINNRMDTVLTTLYLLFNEGYYSLSHDMTLRKDLCLEAMRLTFLLTNNENTNLPKVNALMALMCFHASRFEARTALNGETILYQEQDSGLWDEQLIAEGIYSLSKASGGKELSKYHLEAAIAYWHTFQRDTKEKWNSILQLYNQLLLIEYSPMAALNRTFALSKVMGKAVAIQEAEKLQQSNTKLYFSLLGELYSGIDNEKAVNHFQKAYAMSKSSAEKKILEKKMYQCINDFVNPQE